MKPSKGKFIKVLIADDHEVVRQGIKTILSETPDLRVVAEAEDGMEVLKQIQDLDVDVILLDFDMPKKSGLDTLIELKAIRPQIARSYTQYFSGGSLWFAIFESRSFRVSGESQCFRPTG